MRDLDARETVLSAWQRTPKAISTSDQKVVFRTWKQALDQLKSINCRCIWKKAKDKASGMTTSRGADTAIRCESIYFVRRQRRKKLRCAWNDINKWMIDKTKFNPREQHNESKTREGIKFRRWLSTRLSAKSNWDLRVNNAPNELSKLHMSPILIDLRAEEIIWNDPSFEHSFSRSSIVLVFSFNLLSNCAIMSTEACSISWDITRTPTGPIRQHKFSSAKLEV